MQQNVGSEEAFQIVQERHKNHYKPGLEINFFTCSTGAPNFKKIGPPAKIWERSPKM